MTRILAVSCLALLALVAGVSAQSSSGAAAELRALYFQQDFDGGSAAGAEHVASHPDDPEVRAWYATHLARTDRADSALAVAQAMAERWPESPWPHLARAFALSYGGDRSDSTQASARQAAHRALELAPADPAMVWINGFVLHNQRRYGEVVALIDSLAPRVASMSELVVLKANATLAQGTGRDADPAMFDRGLEIFAEARAMDPGNLNAHYFPGSMLTSSRRVEEAYPLLRRAVELAPYSAGVHSSYWRAVRGLRDRTPEQKRAEIVADVEPLLRERGHLPGTLLTVSHVYRDLEMWDELRSIEERILREHPASVQAEWALVYRYRALSDSIFKGLVADTADARRRLVARLWEFVDWPHHSRESLIGDTYLSLFRHVRRDDTVPADRVLQVVQGMAKYNLINPSTTHSAGPILLADRGIHFREAEAIARAGFEHAKTYMERRRESYKTVGEYADTYDWLRAVHHDALGWVFFNEGRLDDAEKELRRAVELKKDLPLPYYHLGRLAEARGDLEGAELMYARGRGYEIRGEKPNHAALEALYLKKYGTREGLDAYVAALDEKDRQRRRQKIAESRIAEPRPVPAFTLARLDGELVSSERLRGKIAVINFWGVWCGPCVAEAPQIQKFHEKFRDDPDVVFLTIDNDANPDDVRKWMAEKKFDFPVLLDDGYVRKSGVSAFPTTWFIDRDGRIVFEHRGASDVVFEEFVWRVEMLRQPTT